MDERLMAWAYDDEGDLLGIPRSCLVRALPEAPPFRGPILRAKAIEERLSRSWGALVTPGLPPKVRAALDRLREARHAHPTAIRELPAAPLELERTVDRWLEDRDLPTYLLVVAPPTPEQLGAEARLQARHAVGRVWFDDGLVRALWQGERSPSDCFAAYVDRVVPTERVGRGAPRFVFSSGVLAAGDPMADALFPAIGRHAGGCDYARLERAPAAELTQELAARPLDLWIHAGGGLHTRRPAERGSLICASPHDKLTARALLERPSAGKVAWLHGCYMGGTTADPPALRAIDPSWHPDWESMRADLQQHSAGAAHGSAFVHALLGGRDGFHAVLAPFDQVFSSSLDGRRRGDPLAEPRVFGAFVGALLAGKPVGEAFRVIANRELAIHRALFHARQTAVEPRPDRVLRFLAWLNTRQLRVFGDPLTTVALRRA